MRPLVTVIIPTYNWSSALRHSIASALAQTHEEFELLVVGDCCTDDSEAVTRSFADPRVRWHNLPERHRAQSGPNNYGIGIARGSLIAYLGHDDVWHPEHLRSLVEKMEETGADLACAAAVVYGPAGSGIRQITGIFAEGQWRKRDFAPPSSLMHRRSLTDRIGPWGKPAELVASVDVDLILRAHAAGVRMTATGRLTVFKFNACGRRDSYLRRDTSDQEAMLARLQADPARVVEEEWAGLLRAWREHRLGTTILPAVLSGGPGERHRASLRERGLEAPAAHPLRKRRRFPLDDQVSAADWHAVEHSKRWGTYRWTGPAPNAMAVLPVSTSGPVTVRVQLLNFLGADVAGEVTLAVSGQKVEFSVEGGRSHAVRLTARIDEAQTGPLRVEITAARTRCPSIESDGRNADVRWLGVCVNWIEIAPATSSEGRRKGLLRSLLAARR